MDSTLTSLITANNATNICETTFEKRTHILAELYHKYRINSVRMLYTYV